MKLSDLKEKTIIYIDNFKHGNTSSNSLNLQVFKRYYKKVIPVHVRFVDPIQMRCLIWFYKPDQIHYGGSVKNAKLVPLSTYKMVQKSYPTILQSVSYGDLYTSNYIKERANFVNVTTDSYFSEQPKPSVLWFPLTLHARLLDEYAPSKIGWNDKSYDLVFCGSNKDTRHEMLLYLHDKGIKIDVWGEGWEGSPFNIHPQCSILESYKIYQQSKLVLNEMIDDYCHHNGFNTCEKKQTDFYSAYCQNKSCDYYMPKESYTSNRLLIAAYSATPIVTYYNKGLERILSPTKSCVLVDKDNMVESIYNYLNNEEQSTEIGINARKDVSKFCFEQLLLKYWSYLK